MEYRVVDGATDTMLDRVRARWNASMVANDDVLTILSVSLTPRIVAVVVSAVKDEDGETESWHIVVTEGGETTGDILVSNANLYNALSEIAN